MSEPLSEMSFLAHLEELRARLLRVLASLIIVFLILYFALKDQMVELVLLLKGHEDACDCLGTTA